MTTPTIIALTAAGIIAYSLLRKSFGAGSLNFFPGKVHSLDFEGLTPVLTLGLGVQNTSNQSYTLQSFAGSLYSNGIYVGNLSTFDRKTVLPNSQQIIYVAARLQLIGIVNDIIRAFNNNNFSQEVEIKATTNIDGLQVPVKLKFNVGM